MSYRDVSESLRAYRERVAADLEAAREAAHEAAQRAEKVRLLEKELAETDGLIAKLPNERAGRSLPLLENVAIAAPCSADWDQMVGDERMRFCRQCEKNVYNLSALPREEAEALLAAREGKICVRLYRRADGTVLTADCPVGVKRRRRRRAIAGVVGGGLLAAGAALASAAETRTMQGGLAYAVESPDAGAPLPVMGGLPPLEPTAVPAPDLGKVAPRGWTAGTMMPLPPQVPPPPPRKPHGAGAKGRGTMGAAF